MNAPSLRRLTVLGTASSALLSGAGVGVGAVPKSGAKDAIAGLLHLTWLRGSPALRELCTVAAFVSLVALLWCWWQLRRRLDELSPRQVWTIALCWAAPLMVAPPLFSADIYAYAGQGHLVANGVDPYSYGPGAYEPTSKWSFNVDGLWRFEPSPYGALWLWLAGRAVVLSHGHLVVTLYLLRGLAVLGLALVGMSLATLARTSGVALKQSLWLVVANPLVLIHGIAGAHNDLLMLGLLCTGLAVVLRRPTSGGFVAAGVLVALAALIKAPAGLALAFLPFVATTRRGQLRAAVVASSSAAVSALLVSAGSGLGWGWVHVLRADGDRLSVWSVTSGLTSGVGWTSDQLGAALHVNLPSGPAFGTVASLLVAGAVATFWVAAARGSDPVRCLGSALLAVFALSLNVQPWYLVWGLALLASTERRQARTALAVLTTTLCLCLLPGGRSWVRPPFYGAPALAAAAVVLGLRVRHHAGDLRA